MGWILNTFSFENQKLCVLWSDGAIIDFEIQPNKPSMSPPVATENNFCGRESSYLAGNFPFLCSCAFIFRSYFSIHNSPIISNHSIFKKFPTFPTCPITQIWRLQSADYAALNFEPKFLEKFFQRKLFWNSTHVWPALLYCIFEESTLST